MKRIIQAAAAGVAAVLLSCSSPHLAISSSGNESVPAGGSLLIQALAQDSTGLILWTLSGPGFLVNLAGQQNTYYAPATYDPKQTSATITVSLSDTPSEVRTINITITRPNEAISGIPGLSTTVNVGYDTRDIPTINCTKTVDCYAVLGYIQARDRLFQMDFYRRAGRGRLSELIGASALSQDEAIRTLFTTRDGQPVPEALTNHVHGDPLVAPGLAAYTSGVNTFIAQVRAGAVPLPAAYGQLIYPINPSSTDDLPDWSDVDSMAVARLFEWNLSDTTEKEADYGKWAQTWSALDPSGLSIGLWIQAAPPFPSFTLAGTGAPNAPSLKAQPLVLDSLRAAGGVLDAAKAKLDAIRNLRALLGSPWGSNNWVVDKNHTDIGQSFVCNDPHQPLTYPSNFHLSHLIGSEDQLNVMGGAFPGLPATLTGRGAHVGWGVTVVGYDVTDLYLETLVLQGQTPVGISFKGNTVPFIVVPQVYRFRTNTGLATLSNPNPVLVAPPHGPVISLDATHGIAITSRWTGQEYNTDDIRAFLRLNNAASVDDARQALEGDPAPDGGRYTGFWTGAQNFVLADDQGNIGYVPHACVPQRPWAQTKAIYPMPVVPMDGRGSFEWATAPDGGLLCVTDDKLPISIGSNKGYLATANSDPLGVTADNNPYENNPGGVPYLSFEWSDPLGVRISRIQGVLDAKLDGGAKVTLDDMQALQKDHVSLLARPFQAFIQAIGAANSDNPNVKGAAQMLLAWGTPDSGTANDCPTGLAAGSLDPASAVNDSSDVATPGTNSANSAACLLFHTFLRRVLEQTFTDEEAVVGAGRSPGNEIRALLTLLSGQVPNPNNVFCRDVDASGQVVNNKTCVQQVTDALGWAYATLKNNYGAVSNWRWGRVHTITFSFVIPGYPLVDPAFQPGPYPRPGGAFTVDVGNPITFNSASLSFPYGSGGAVRWRAAMDGTVANTFMQLPGVQSAGPFPFGQQTMLTDWVTNTYFNFPFQASDVTSVRTESFTP